MPLIVALFAAFIAVLTPAAPAMAQTRSIDIWLGGRETTADMFVPERATRDAVILAHGFTRHRGTMTAHAERLAREGNLVVVPDMPFFWHSGDNARALRDLVRMLLDGTLAPPVSRIVLVGFSAGGLAALLATDAPGVVGYVGLDPFDRPSGLGLDVAKKLALPAYLLRAPSSRCNAFAIAAPWKDAFPQLAADRVFEGATHCDFEAPTDGLCRAACGGTDEAQRKRIGDALDGAVRALLPARAP
jgi:dienelactone hydrolase